MKSVKLRTKLSIIMMFSIIAIACVAIFGVISVGQISNRLENVSVQNVAVLTRLTRMVESFGLVRMYVRDSVIAISPEHREEYINRIFPVYDQLLEDTRAYIRVLIDNNLQDTEEYALATHVYRSLPHAAEIVVSIVEMTLEGRLEEAAYRIETVCVPFNDALARDLSRLAFINEARAYDTHVAAEHLARRSRIIVIAAALSVTFVLLVLNVLLIRATLRSIGHMMAASRDLALGNTAVNLDTSRNDELGELARSFSSVVDSVVKLETSFREKRTAFVQGELLFRSGDNGLPGVYGTISEDVDEIANAITHYLEFVFNPIVVVDLGLKITFANRRARRLTKIQDALGMYINDFLGDVSQNPALLSAIKKGKGNSVEATLTLGGQMLEVEFDCTPILENGQVVSVMILLIDMTQIKNSAAESAVRVQYTHEQTETLNYAISRLEQGKLNIKAQSRIYDSITEDIAQQFDKIESVFVDSVGTIRRYIDELTSVMANMSEKNFDREITNHYVGDFAAIKDSVNQIIGSMNLFFEDLRASSVQVSEGTGYLSQASEDMAANILEQMQAVAGITNAVNEISQGLSRDMTTVTDTSRLSQEASGWAGEGSNQMNSMVSAMKEVRESSNQVAGIIKMINDIAFQTNLLALNAAVEAARAGVHGQGFAVVAQEVRVLASRSAESAKQSAEIIETSLQRVNSGAELAESTSRTLAKIVSAISEMGKYIEEISASSAEKNTSLESITKELNAINRLTQQNSDFATQNAATSQEITKQANILQEMIAEFNLK